MDIQRWKTFSRQQQLLMVASEIKRAATWQASDRELFQDALLRCTELIDLLKQDSKWEPLSDAVHVLANEVEKYAHGVRTDDIQYLYRAL